MPKISVIIPVYNVEKYLRECLDSVLAQTMRDFEVICVDDGSTDGSSTILDEYAVKDERLCVVHGEHSNAGRCRNVGLDLARGKYLSFLDSDDVFAPKMLEILYGVAEKTQAEIVNCQQIGYQDGEVMPAMDEKWTSDRVTIIDDAARQMNVFLRFNGRAWDKLFSAAFVRSEGLRFQEIRSTNDARFTYSALCLAKRVVDIRSVLIAHRHHGDSLEATRSKGVGCMREMQLSFYCEMQKRGVFQRSSKILRDFKLWCIQVAFWYIDTIDTARAYEEAVAYLKQVAAELNLYELLDIDLTLAKWEKEVLLALKTDCSALEFAMLRNCQLRNTVSHSQFRITKSYRIGLLVTWLPRKFEQLYGKWKKHRRFVLQCKCDCSLKQIVGAILTF